MATQCPEAELEMISYWIGERLIFWSRLPVSQMKEKYSTVRVYCRFGNYNLHSLLFPQWHYRHHKYPDWLWNLDHTNGVMAIFSGLNYLLVPWQMKVYRWIYKRAVTKWPQYRKPILCFADYSELLEGL